MSNLSILTNQYDLLTLSLPSPPAEFHAEDFLQSRSLSKRQSTGCMKRRSPEAYCDLRPDFASSCLDDLHLSSATKQQRRSRSLKIDTSTAVHTTNTTTTTTSLTLSSPREFPQLRARAFSMPPLRHFETELSLPATDHSLFQRKRAQTVSSRPSDYFSDNFAPAAISLQGWNHWAECSSPTVHDQLMVGLPSPTLDDAEDPLCLTEQDLLPSCFAQQPRQVNTVTAPTCGALDTAGADTLPVVSPLPELLKHCSPCVRTDLQALTLSSNKTSRRLVAQLPFASAGEAPTPRYVIRLDRGHAAVFSIAVGNTMQSRRFFQQNVERVIYQPYIHYLINSDACGHDGLGQRSKGWKRTTMKPGLRWKVVDHASVRPQIERSPDKNARDVPEWEDEHLSAGADEGYAIAARFFNPLREEGIVCRDPTPMFFSASASIKLSVTSEVRRRAVRQLAFWAKMNHRLTEDWTGTLAKSLAVVEAELMMTTTKNAAITNAIEALQGSARQWFEQNVVKPMMDAGTVELPGAPVAPASVADARPICEGGCGPWASTCVFFGRAHLNRRTTSPTASSGKSTLTNKAVKTVWQWVPGTTCICSSKCCSREVFVGNREKAAEAALNNRAQEWFS